MMKKRMKKLELSRTTLRPLAPETLEEVRGGTLTRPPRTVESICPCMSMAVCTEVCPI
jgi:hypothetical protein